MNTDKKADKNDVDKALGSIYQTNRRSRLEKELGSNNFEIFLNNHDIDLLNKIAETLDYQDISVSKSDKKTNLTEDRSYLIKYLIRCYHELIYIPKYEKSRKIFSLHQKIQHHLNEKNASLSELAKNLNEKKLRTMDNLLYEDYSEKSSTWSENMIHEMYESEQSMEELVKNLDKYGGNTKNPLFRKTLE